ncbi:MAG: Rrf2 family transcriptional regulator [Firmicutes bacterium]|nr:Rrf2 family transcriptional regulator [Bacillota bacterium]
MKISTKGRYALRMMIDIASHQDEGNISLKDIAKRQEISMKYLEQIVSPLTHAGLIRSTRGAQGGYSLLRYPKDYNALEIIEAVEGKLAVVSCLETPTNVCPRYASCSTIHMYEGLNKVMRDYLEKFTLQDFLDQGVNDYVI